MSVSKYKPDPKLKEYATAVQAQYIDAVIEVGVVGAAKRFGVGHGAVSHALQAVKKKAALAGFAPEAGMTHVVPAPFAVKGVSSYYNKDGDLAGQWVKSKLDDQQAAEAIREWVEGVIGDARGLSPLVQEPDKVNGDLLAVYPFGDPHFGMYAWAAEAGEDFDLSIADKVTRGAIDRLLLSAPPAETCIVLILGDTFHANDQTNVTPGHKHQLDVDSRYPKVIKVGINAVRHVILRALEKHKNVFVRIEPGNHDPQAKWALTLALSMHFENNDRVTIDESPSKFWYYQFGQVLIGSTHGDTIKHEGLPGVMAADKPMEWGHSKHRYWYTGHVHTQVVKEFSGVICESFRSLVAKDAWTAGRGYRAGRDLYCIVHHKDHGEIERHRCDVGMIP